MGFLHDGHLELVRRAREANERVAVSIFVNPKQFGPTEDLARYPRDLERDLTLLERERVDLVFVPDNEEMYPGGYQTTVKVTEVTQYLEGAKRPTHFEGVTTVLAKLFNIAQPDRVYFGQKDAQQTIVVQRMVRDLNFDVEIIVCPTGREADGLAMSSRNKYLAGEERTAATVLIQSLRDADALWAEGERNAEVIRQAMQRVLRAEPLAQVDYVSVADTESLAEWEKEIPAGRDALVSLAVFIGQTRLIDNVVLTHTSNP
jgi:pantoate--beta-alanine ligase